jgi:hypothetical protein
VCVFESSVATVYQPVVDADDVRSLHHFLQVSPDSRIACRTNAVICSGMGAPESTESKCSR